MKRTFAIGDIHGCYYEMMLLFDTLKKEANLDFKKDRVVFLGDYIDRGTGAKEVVSQLIEWNKKYPHWEFLMGNHEDLMLDALVYKGQIYDDYYLWWNQGGKETAKSYIPKDRTTYEKAISSVKSTIPAEHLEWLVKRPYYTEDDKYFYVHGGVLPNTSLEELKKYLDERGFNDVKQSTIWARDEFIFSKYNWGKKIIFGHTADYDGRYAVPPGSSTFEPIVRKNKIGIDTACCPPASKKLTAVELPAEKFYFQNSLLK